MLGEKTTDRVYFDITRITVNGGTLQSTQTLFGSRFPCELRIKGDAGKISESLEARECHNFRLWSGGDRLGVNTGRGSRCGAIEDQS